MAIMNNCGATIASRRPRTRTGSVYCSSVSHSDHFTHQNAVRLVSSLKAGNPYGPGKGPCVAPAQESVAFPRSLLLAQRP